MWLLNGLSTGCYTHKDFPIWYRSSRYAIYNPWDDVSVKLYHVQSQRSKPNYIIKVWILVINIGNNFLIDLLC